MNKKQKAVLIVVAVVILIMLLYPPYIHIDDGKIIGRHHYDWIFERWAGGYIVNIPLLLTQWLGLLIIGAIAFFILKDK